MQCSELLAVSRQTPKFCSGRSEDTGYSLYNIMDPGRMSMVQLLGFFRGTQVQVFSGQYLDFTCEIYDRLTRS